MNIIINNRNLAVTDAIRERVESRVNSALDLYAAAITSVRVLLEKESAKQGFKVEISAHMPHHDLIASAENPDFYAALDAAADKVSSQAEKITGKLHDHQAAPLREAAGDGE